MKQYVGKQSIQFERAPHIIGSASVVGKKEGEGPFGRKFDLICNDDKFGEENWEKSESTMQREALQLAFANAKLRPYQIRCLFGGDLLGQLIATSFGVEDYNIPLFGLYGACSTCGESLGLAAMTIAGGFADYTAAVTSSHFASAEKQFRFPLAYGNQRPTCGESLGLAAMTIAGGFADYTAAVTSSHFASAEKQFRFPLAYGNQRPLSATWTVTGSGAFVLAEKGGKVRISGVTTGKVVDFGVKDSMNMGACMAPAACDTIYQNLMDFNRQPSDYDAIITGDLGYVGQEILIELMKEKGFDISEQHQDCGIEIYDRKIQDTHSGGSGCGCSAVMLSAYILPRLEKGVWKRVLFVPTGALLSTVSFNEGQSVPGIAHAVVLEYCG